MEHRDRASDPTPPTKPIAPPSNADTVLIGDDTLGVTPAPQRAEPLDSTQAFAPEPGADEPPPAPRPKSKPTGKPRPAAAADLEATGAFTEAAAPPEGGNETTLRQPTAGTGLPAPVRATSAPGSGPRSATRQPGANSSGGAPSSASMSRSVLGEYRLLKKLGAGGMGTVYLAEQVNLGRKVALKVLSKELAGKPGFIERFQREARLMARLDHPNIVRCHDVGTVAGHHYLALDFIDGGSVEQCLKRLGKFSLGDALHVTLACARALEHAHGLSMIHRDIKPDNLLLTSKGMVKLADLGLAKAADDDLSLTRTGTGAGTPLYMAPEQARDVKHVDQRCDIYALGCMLYCFLTGQLPFTGETLLEVIDAKTKGKFTPARRLNADIPPRLDLIIDKLLAANPAHRYQSCTELIADLEELGLASAQLSFAQAGLAGDTAPSVVPKAPTQQPQQPARPTDSTRVAAPGEADTGTGWFIVLPVPGNRTITHPVKPAEMVELVKKGELTADTLVCRSPAGARRAAGTYPEINALFQLHTAKSKVDQKARKYRQLYEQIEADGKRHQRAKRWKKLTKGVTGLIGFALWLCIIAALLAGGAYLAWKYLR